MSRYVFLFNLDAFFKQSFLQQMESLRKISGSEARRMAGEIQLNEKLAAFIKKNRDRCYIVTECLNVPGTVDKNAVFSQMKHPFVAVGNGDGDAGMIAAAEIGIGYGGVRSISPAVLACASHAVYEEDKLVDFLERLV